MERERGGQEFAFYRIGWIVWASCQRASPLVVVGTAAVDSTSGPATCHGSVSGVGPADVQDAGVLVLGMAGRSQRQQAYTPPLFEQTQIGLLDKVARRAGAGIRSPSGPGASTWLLPPYGGPHVPGWRPSKTAV